MMNSIKNKKIGIIGHFGGKEIFLDGQTVKTKILYEELLNNTDWKIKKIDTYYKKKNPIKLVWDSLCCFLGTRDIIVLLSRNGMQFYFPILYILVKLMNIRVYHDVIGCNINRYISMYPKFKKYLNSFQYNWVETQKMKKELEHLGVDNCEVIPNFKRLQKLNLEDIQLTKVKVPFRFCTFSRVMKEKGIEEAIEAIESINSEKGELLCKLDIYGVIDEGYKERFSEILKYTTPAINYCGVVHYNKSVDVIRSYYALLFPTYWETEGFPGTIIDAFSSAVPVIATNWNSNSEIIIDKVNGILCETHDIESLKSSIRWLIYNSDKLHDMKCNCILSAREYEPDKYIREIIEKIEKGRKFE